MANSNSGGNQINVPQAKDALNNMKYEIARELGVNLKQGYNGDLTSREAGYVGGYMVKHIYTGRRLTFRRKTPYGRGSHEIPIQINICFFSLN